MTAPVSVVVITQDEERHIERCLKSVQWVAEIVVVDAYSKDATVKLATSLGARVTQQAWPGYARQKNFAISQAHQPWILSLDADEEVTATLAAEIEETTRSEVPEAGFHLRRPTYFLGRPLHHYGRGHDRGQLRLFRNGRGHFEDRPVHERVQVEGKIGWLAAPLLHHSYPNVSTYWRKIHRYAALEARERVTRGHVPGHPWARAAVKLGWMLVWRRGLLDGPPAWLWIAGQAYQEWLSTRLSVRLLRKEATRGIA